MDEATKQELLKRAQKWMREELIPAHTANTLKLKSLSEFQINSFLWPYLAYYLEGDNDPVSLAKVLVYPRILGSSVNTSFGQRAQSLITRLFAGTLGSGIPGIDIEFEDKTDNRKKYCQVKAGPNVINKDDVDTIKHHFTDLKNLARTNGLDLRTTDMMFCLLYGEEGEKNTHIENLEKEYVVVMGRDFWQRLTGDAGFYDDLVNAMGEVAVEVDMKETVDEVIQSLAQDIKKNYKQVI